MPKKTESKTPVGYHICPQCGGVAEVHGAAKEGRIYLRHDAEHCRLYMHARGAEAQAEIEANMVDSPEKVQAEAAPVPEPPPEPEAPDVVADVVRERGSDAVVTTSDDVPEAQFDPDRDMTPSTTTSGPGGNGPLWALLGVLLLLLCGGGYAAYRYGQGTLAIEGPDNE